MNKTKRPPEHFPIVGIGASAGGLEALQHFFDQVSSTLGMAFVVIQHLSPDFESLMKELLSKRTQMKIKKVEGPTEVQANHVYLLPRRKDIIIEGRTLQLLDRNPETKLHLPIDVFFNSLGNAVKENAVAVILSGSGTDGSRGVRTVKENGGIVFVQSPESAQFDGMPNASITLNIADKVLTSTEIASEINRIFGEDTKANTAKTDTKLSGILGAVLALVKKVTDVDFRLYREQTLYRRIEKRMSINGVKSPLDYLKYLNDNEEETNILFYEFLIGVTAFFRDKEAFESIKHYVIPEIFNQHRPSEKIRIWVAGCSTGEEAYSIAILMSDFIERNKLPYDYKIFASDINKQAIDFASQGVYYNNIAGDLSTRQLEKNFIPCGGNTYQVKKKIREKIVFTVHDITKDPPFIKVDLVICRNLLIYFNPTTQQEILTNFHFALNNDGYLFLGQSESVGGLKNAFAAIDKKWNIYKNVLDVKIAPRQINHEVRNRRKDRKIKPFVENTIKQEFLSQRSTDYFSSILIKEFAPICVFLNRKLDVLYINGALEQLMRFPQRFADLNIMNMTDSEESLLFRDGIRKVEEEHQSVFYRDIIFNKDETQFLIDLRFKKFKLRKTGDEVYLAEIYLKGKNKTAKTQEREISEQTYRDDRLKTLESELDEAKQESKILVEQLETTNEELQSSNEELLAANEELQSTNEELQSVNEELYTVNTELQTKIEELTIVNNDIDNLLKSTAIGTIFLDNELRIRKFTPAIEEQFSLVETDIGRAINNFTSKFEDKNVYQDAQKVLSTLMTIEREVTTKDQSRTFLMRILPYRTTENSIEGVVLTFIDIGEVVNVRKEVLSLNKSLEYKVSERTKALKQSNEELERANSYLDSFVFATAHDLRSPVLNLKSFTSIMNRLESMEEKERVIEQISTSVDRLESTLNGLIEMIDFQKSEHQIVKNLNFSSVFKTVTAELKPQIDECQPTPTFETDFKVKNIKYVSAYLYSIIYNLIDNAIKYRDYDRPLNIKISTDTLDKHTALCVEDNGIGIDLKKHGNVLFKPFKRLNVDREGRGIGLSLINEAVAKNGGSIEVSSSIGEGTKFVTYLHHY